LGSLIEKYQDEERAEAGTGPEVGGDDPGDPDFSDVGAPGLIDRDTFADMLGGMIGITGSVAGLATLHRSPTLPNFRPAADEFYAVCRRVPSLNFLVQPENETFKAVVVIGAWAAPVVRGCMEEVKLKQRAKAAANDNRAQAKPKPSGVYDIPEPKPGETAPQDPEAAQPDGYYADEAA
jgi:hypothetical protein